jgi:hypothetical protein
MPSRLAPDCTPATCRAPGGRRCAGDTRSESIPSNSGLRSGPSAQLSQIARPPGPNDRGPRPYRQSDGFAPGRQRHAVPPSIFSSSACRLCWPRQVLERMSLPKPIRRSRAGSRSTRTNRRPTGPNPSPRPRVLRTSPSSFRTTSGSLRRRPSAESRRHLRWTGWPPKACATTAFT